MISRKAAIIVGAGASFDLGMPLGSGLKKRVATVLLDERSERAHFFRAALMKVFDGNQELVSRAIRHSSKFADAMAASASIDNFLDQHRDAVEFVIAAKLAIA